MNLSGAFKPIEKLDGVLNLLRKVNYLPFVLPLLVIPFPSMAANVAPAGFESFPTVEYGFPQNLIDINKNCVEFIL